MQIKNLNDLTTNYGLVCNIIKFQGYKKYNTIFIGHAYCFTVGYNGLEQ